MYRSLVTDNYFISSKIPSLICTKFDVNNFPHIELSFWGFTGMSLVSVLLFVCPSVYKIEKYWYFCAGSSSTVFDCYCLEILLIY